MDTYMATEAMLVPFSFKFTICCGYGLFFHCPIASTALGQVEHIKIRAAIDPAFTFHQAGHFRIDRLITMVASDVFWVVILAQCARRPDMCLDRSITGSTVRSLLDQHGIVNVTVQASLVFKRRRVRI